MHLPGDLKMEWAKYHFHVLGKHITAAREVQPYELSRVDNAGHATDHLVRVQWRYSNVKQPPDEWGLILGDIFTNLRASLDHTFSFFKNSVNDGTRAIGGGNYPIYRSKADFEKWARKSELPAPLIAATERNQPYHRGEEDAAWHPLALLQTAVNATKHSDLTVTNIAVVAATCTTTPPVTIVKSRPGNGSIEENAVALTVHLVRGRSPRADVDVHPTFARNENVVIDGIGSVPINPTVQLMIHAVNAARLDLYDIALLQPNDAPEVVP